MIQKHRTWELLAPAAASDHASGVFDVILVTLIVLNVIAVLVGSVAEVRDAFGPLLSGFEVFSVMVFTLEYLARAWSCTVLPEYAGPIRGRLRFLMRPLQIIDLLAILPFYVATGLDLRVMRVFRLLRLLRILKLARYTRAFGIIWQVIVGKREELVLAFVMLMLLLVVSASLMYYVEGEAQPEEFSSIPATIWWSVVTLTTVGYGDVYPVTVAGKLVAGVISILGIGMVALPAGIISAGFVEEITSRPSELHCDDKFCPTCGRALEEGDEEPPRPPDRQNDV